MNRESVINGLQIRATPETKNVRRKGPFPRKSGGTFGSKSVKTESINKNDPPVEIKR